MITKVPRRARVLLPIAALVVTGCTVLSAILPSPPPPTTATVELRDLEGKIVGNATLTQMSDGVRLVLDARGLPAGGKAVHFHDAGRCEPPFSSAGGHFNPERKRHGLLNPDGPHAGDLANIRIGADGAGRLETMDYRVSLDPGTSSLFDTDGTALVIHAGPDDFSTDPTGNSGAPIACGVLSRTKTNGDEVGGPEGPRTRP